DLGHVEREVGRGLRDLHLYRRAEQVFSGDPSLVEAYRARQDRLIRLQRLYRQRLRQLVSAAIDLYALQGEPALLTPERRHAISQLRSLDAHHVARVRAIHAEFEADFDPVINPLLARHVAEISSILDGCAGLLITGGNVAVLLNRMRLFGIGSRLDSIPVVGWSAGAMVLTERIVLFHDKLPRRRRDAEILSPGFGLLPGWVFLPDAAHRLDHDDVLALDVMARRFQPARCVLLDNGVHMVCDGQQPLAGQALRSIERGGRIGALPRL
ncbi:MAG: Type 1 glutamine amidotransferase-like domain-containing protein, partial [Xanthomonadales bacterium]|nr:Type 1 glutamine amidotransferase-like domain-containing protein [Xanthomonadales bacterium]